MRISAKAVIELAEREIGVTEKPVNNVKYNTLFYGREVSGSNLSWCCVFIWWLFNTLNAREMFFDGEKTASCTTLFRWAEANGAVVNSGYQPGDIVFYDWDGSGDCDHVGILCAIEGGTAIVIEGNTSLANDSNGGAVMRRARPLRVIKAAWRPDYAPDYSELVDVLTPEQAYKLLQKAQSYAAALDAPGWLSKSGELDKAVEAGITDGSAPCRFATRYEVALMAKRASEK